MLKKICFYLCFGVFCVCVGVNAYAEEFEEVFIEERSPDEISAQALEDYQVEGSLFERITSLEQEKLVMQLEKDRIELDLALDRLNKEKIKVKDKIQHNIKMLKEAVNNAKKFEKSYQSNGIKAFPYN